VFLLKKTLNVVQVDVSTTFSDIECVCFDFYSNLNSSTRFFIVYRPPGESAQANLVVFKMLIDCIEKHCPAGCTSIIVGDLNCPGIHWAEAAVYGDNNQLNFFNALCDLGFIQYVTEPTREKSILDIILCNDPYLVCDVLVGSPFSTSDHCIVNFTLNLPSNSNVESDSRTDTLSTLLPFLWKQANWEKMESFINALSWDTFFPSDANAETCWETFCQILSYAVNLFVLKLNSRKRKGKRLQKKHTDKFARKLQTRKLRLWRKYKASKSKRDKRKYNKVARKLKVHLANNHSNAEKLVLNSGNLGKFYKFVNSKLSSKSGIGPLKDSEGDLHFTDEEKATLLNDYFSNVCTQDNGVLPLNLDSLPAPTNEFLESVHFSCTSSTKY